MFADNLYHEIFSANFDPEELFIDYRDQRGDYRLGRIEEDPEMCEYEDVLSLASSLRN